MTLRQLSTLIGLALFLVLDLCGIYFYQFVKEKKKLAAENITFPLAAFLVGAQEHSYFIYNWGYRMRLGCLEWYPELDKQLGPPLADAKQTGWVLERDFEHAQVWIDLEAREARIEWR